MRKKTHQHARQILSVYTASHATHAKHVQHRKRHEPTVHTAIIRYCSRLQWKYDTHTYPSVISGGILLPRKHRKVHGFLLITLSKLSRSIVHLPDLSYSNSIWLGTSHKDINLSKSLGLFTRHQAKSSNNYTDCYTTDPKENQCGWVGYPPQKHELSISTQDCDL